MAIGRTNASVGGGSQLKALIDGRQNCSSLFYEFSGTSVNDLISYNDTENAKGMTNMFNSCGKLTSIPLLNTSKVNDMYGTFFRCNELTSIPALDVSNVNNFDNAFYGCSNLESIEMTGMKVSFDIHWSTKLTREALVVILNNLATVSTSKKLTMGAENLAKVTEEDKLIATNKGWTLA